VTHEEKLVFLFCDKLNPMKQLTKLLMILAIGILCCRCTQKRSRIIGVKIYEYNGNYNALAGLWKEMGINTAFISTSLAANGVFRNALKKNNISVFVIFPVFQNPVLLKQDTSLYAITSKGLKAKDDWVEFVCPSRQSYRNSKINEIAELIRNLRPDGISIDFIRQFVFWEMIYPDREPGSIDRACFCDSCITEFSRLEAISFSDSCLTTLQKANYVALNYSDSWDAYRCNLITTMVKELAEKAREIQQDLKICIHAVPWREGEFEGANIRVAAQDLHKISSYTDYISPMCYSQMLKRDADWIAGVVDDMDKSAIGKVLPSIQVSPYYINRPYTKEDFRKCIEKALEPPSQGVVFFSWPLFEKDPSRIEVVREAVASDLHHQ